jgi:guanylate kinase
MSAKRIFIIAGPSGAGKTTFALEYLPREEKLDSSFYVLAES